MDELARALEARIDGEVRFDGISKMLYRTDASIYEMEPVGVVVPRNAQDVVETVSLAAEYGVSLLPRGSGTSLAGQSVGRSLHVDFSKYLDRILELNTAERWVRVQPGVVLDELNSYLAPHNLMFAPDVATSSRANIGGMIGNNSCGAHSVIYGKTIDHVQSLTAVLSDAATVELGPIQSALVALKTAQGDLEGDIYSVMRRVLDVNGDEIRARFPRVMRRVSGYNLDELLASADNSMDLTKIVVGSEGTLCIVTEAQLSLVERPQYTVLIACHFSDLLEAIRANAEILETGPSAIELTDRILLDQTRDSIEHAPRPEIPAGRPGGAALRRVLRRFA